MVFYDGEYHLFYQHNPTGINWGNMHWGHAVSTDLVHWQELPIAIAPDSLGTIYSGSAVIDWENTAGFPRGGEKTLVAIYTSAGGSSPESQGQPYTQSIAYSTDRGRTFTKFAGNPVMKHIVDSNRDPKVVWHAPTRRWIMALYKTANTYVLLASPNLKEWTALHDIEMPECSECPDFFEIAIEGESETRWVFTAADGRYYVGTFDGKKFKHEPELLRVDWSPPGKFAYAVQTYSDIPKSDGRRIQIAWMTGGKYPGMPFNQQMGFPCELTLRRTPDGLRLFKRPVAEIALLRKTVHSFDGLTVDPAGKIIGSGSDLLEIEGQFNTADCEEFGFIIRGSKISYNVRERKLSAEGGEVILAPAPKLDLHILVDRTSIEIFANGGEAAITYCFLPPADDLDVKVFASGGKAKADSLKVRELNSAHR